MLELFRNMEIIFSDNSVIFLNRNICLQPRSMEVLVESQDEGFVVMNAVEVLQLYKLFDLISSCVKCVF